MIRQLFTAASALTMIAAAPAWAQATSQDLMAMEPGALRGEIQQRYDAALALSADPAIIGADDTRFNWANEAKVQCGIALGFLKSSTRDATSIANCAMAAGLMNRRFTPAPVPQVLPVAQSASDFCRQALPGIVFFEFDSASPPADSQQTIETVARNAGPCGWRSFSVVGHTDRAGSDAYNDGLSRRRADAVAALMTSMGIAPADIATSARGEAAPRVPTEDGARNPQNRRVEIGVR